MTGDSLERTLAENNVAQEAVAQVVACLRECDFGRFVSASPSSDTMRALSGKIRSTIGQLERTYR